MPQPFQYPCNSGIGGGRDKEEPFDPSREWEVPAYRCFISYSGPHSSSGGIVRSTQQRDRPEAEEDKETKPNS